MSPTPHCNVICWIFSLGSSPRSCSTEHCFLTKNIYCSHNVNLLGPNSDLCSLLCFPPQQHACPTAVSLVSSFSPVLVKLFLASAQFPLPRKPTFSLRSSSRFTFSRITLAQLLRNSQQVPNRIVLNHPQLVTSPSSLY